MNINNTDLNIRPEVEQDMAFVDRLYRSTREDLLQLGLAEALMDNLIQMQLHAQKTGYRMQFPDADYSIVEKKGEAIGYLVIDKGDEAIRLVYIAFLPHERNRGHGSRLIQALQTQASGANKPIKLSVDPQNMQAKHLYLSSGFQVKNNDGANLEMVWLGQAKD
ncbi:MAG: GNAT family N-acetyltransferase [Methylobacter sp.]|nr:GNAT family N-acetyltransferase [Methylobacter sp.]